MFKAHDVLECPSDDAVLWRFMDFTKYFSLLRSGALYFSPIKVMEDKYEGVMTRPNVDAASEVFRHLVPAEDLEDVLGENRRTDEMLRGTFCVSCWHCNPHQSAAMWELYLKSDEGVAIRTTFAGMKRAFAATPDEIYPAVVKYLDYTTDVYPQFNAFLQVAHKRKNFEHEHEVRLIWWAGSMSNPDPIPRTYDATGRAVKVDLPALVQQVYVAPKAPSWFRAEVEAVTKDYDLACPVIPSDLYKGPAW
jgi:hypothetical protein